MVTKPDYGCPRCQRETGFKRVPLGCHGQDRRITSKRASCRFCGFIPEENRAGGGA